MVNRPVERRRGGSGTGCLIWLVVSAVVLFYAVNLGQVWWRYWEIKERMQAVVRLWHTNARALAGRRPGDRHPRGRTVPNRPAPDPAVHHDQHRIPGTGRSPADPSYLRIQAVRLPHPVSVHSTAAKVRPLAAAVDWRRGLNGTVVFTNGVFDILHRGHVEYLEQARALGDHLIVGVNSDESARGLAKAPGRPVLPDADRGRVVAGLGVVDCVVIFDEPTPLAAIAALTPDVLVKGGDYRRATVVGADFVEGRGGRVGPARRFGAP